MQNFCSTATGGLNDLLHHPLHKIFFSTLSITSKFVFLPIARDGANAARSSFRGNPILILTESRDPGLENLKRSEHIILLRTYIKEGLGTRDYEILVLRNKQVNFHSPFPFPEVHNP